MSSDALFEVEASPEPAGIALAFEVLGRPAPQGSKTAFVNRYTGRAQMKESSKGGVDLWRSDVVSAARAALPDDWEPLEGPLRVTMILRFARPKSHFGGGRNAHVLKDQAPAYPAGRPDLDKLIRSTSDAMTTAGIYRDDSQIVDFGHTCKVYCAPDERPGATVIVRTL